MRGFIYLFAAIALLLFMKPLGFRFRSKEKERGSTVLGCHAFDFGVVGRNGVHRIPTITVPNRMNHRCLILLRYPQRLRKDRLDGLQRLSVPVNEHIIRGAVVMVDEAMPGLFPVVKHRRHRDAHSGLAESNRRGGVSKIGLVIRAISTFADFSVGAVVEIDEFVDAIRDREPVAVARFRPGPVSPIVVHVAPSDGIGRAEEEVFGRNVSGIEAVFPGPVLAVRQREGVEGQDIVPVHRVLAESRSDLLEVAGALRTAGGLSGARKDGEEQGREDREDDDHSQEFDQSKAATGFAFGFHFSHPP